MRRRGTTRDVGARLVPGARPALQLHHAVADAAGEVAFWQDHVHGQRLIWVGRPRARDNRRAKARANATLALFLGALGIAAVAAVRMDAAMAVDIAYVLLALAVCYGLVRLSAARQRAKRNAARYAASPLAIYAFRSQPYRQPRHFALTEQSRLFWDPDPKDPDDMPVGLADVAEDGTISDHFMMPYLDRAQLAALARALGLSLDPQETPA